MFFRLFFLVFCQLDAATNPKITTKSKIFEKILKKRRQPCRPTGPTSPTKKQPVQAFAGALDGLLMNYCISSSKPVTESMMNPLTTTSLGMSGWVLMVSTVLRTDVGVSLNPSNQ